MGVTKNTIDVEPALQGLHSMAVVPVDAELLHEVIMMAKLVKPCQEDMPRQLWIQSNN